MRCLYYTESGLRNNRKKLREFVENRCMVWYSIEGKVCRNNERINGEKRLMEEEEK